MFNTSVFAPDQFAQGRAQANMKPQMAQMGASMLQQGGQDRAAMIDQLARMGAEPPVVPMQGAPGPGVGQALGGYQQALGVPRTMPKQSPGMAATNPSVGQLLSQGY